MKRVGFLFGVLCLFWLVGCQDRDDLLNEKVVEENREYLIREVTKKFFTVDTVKYQQLKRDAGFVELCEYYEAMEKRVMAGMRERLHKIETRKWFEKMDWAIEDYQCDNLFAYVLRYLNEKENLSRISHIWGQCYYNGIDAVCDTYKYWQDFWGLNARMEMNAFDYMGANFDLRLYRTAYLEYQIVYDRAMFADQYFSFYKDEVLDVITGSYYQLQNLPLDFITSKLKHVYGIPSDYVCYFIGEWEKSYMRFYNSRIWVVNHAEAGRFPPSGGGGDSDKDIFSGLSPEMIEVIDSSDLKNKKFINCALNVLIMKSSIFNGLIREFNAKNSKAHLRFVISEDLPEKTNGRLVRELDNYWLTIELNANLNERPSLVAVKTIIHETIHAHIFMQLLNIQNTWGTASLSAKEFKDLSEALDQQNYPTLYYYYNKYQSHATAQHEYMATYYVPLIADALFEATGVSYDICEAIAWQGLNEISKPGGGTEKTETWEQLSEKEKIRIKNTYDDYLRKGEIKCFD